MFTALCITSSSSRTIICVQAGSTVYGRENERRGVGGGYVVCLFVGGGGKIVNMGGLMKEGWEGRFKIINMLGWGG